MSRRTLSKSDFKVARECPTKLYYKKRRYPSAKDANEYLEFLAKGGFLVGKLAQLYYPEGHEITSGDRATALAETEKWLDAEERVVLFEPAIVVNERIARVDILVKEGDRYQLIEVKSKAGDSRGNDWHKSAWTPYLEDVTFQTLLLEDFLTTRGESQATVEAFLFLPDTARTAELDNLLSLFRLREDQDRSTAAYRAVTVDFLGDEAQAAALRDDGLMTLFNVDREVARLRNEVNSATNQFVASLRGNEIKRITVPLNKNCFKCEYRVGPEVAPNGFRECWGELADVQPHIMNLFKVGLLGGWQNPKADQWIKHGHVCVYDVPEQDLDGKIGERIRIQIEHTRSGEEWLHPDLRNELANWDYPLHFIDFEASLSAIPFHAGLAPYDWICFQWSCHTIPKRGAEPVHAEWLNEESRFPSFDFARSLKDHLDLRGTFLMWHHFENTKLREIFHFLDQFNETDPELRSWLEQVVSFDQSDDGWFVDMDRLTREYYFHPAMGGRTSIKKVLPAVLREDRSPRIRRWLQQFDPAQGLDLLAEDRETDGLADPYKKLPDVPVLAAADGAERIEAIREGTGAMAAYHMLTYGEQAEDPIARDQISQGLRWYCKLDTLAMVIIWEHWRETLGLPS